MEFLKKHYEKLILIIVLLGLAAVGASLPMKVNQERAKEEERKNSLINPPIKPFEAISLATNQSVLEKVKKPIKFDIAGKHNLFNPVPWVERPNGELVKVQGGNVGIGALEVTAVNPLHEIVTFDQVTPTSGPNNTTEYRYQITVVREGFSSGAKQTRVMTIGQTAGGVGTLKSIQGPPENPAAVVMELPDRKQITVAKDAPFSRVIGYSADLVCSLPQFERKGVKLNEIVQIPPDAYKVVSIDTNVVVLRDVRNQKNFPKAIANPK